MLLVPVFDQTNLVSFSTKKAYSVCCSKYWAAQALERGGRSLSIVFAALLNGSCLLALVTLPFPKEVLLDLPGG